ncbi:hypothetical protein PsorP6_016671 [Peronosclerospora sorghi]|uniref:Uncharacterized protein n=1 Tax=Peronosclerospora sorghi TaxID=230839 RepID=A0ACC0VLV5_9STRA|nr:hypothetical protein PsorP6_016671 [Peronosclerospora sorghi]
MVHLVALAGVSTAVFTSTAAFMITFSNECSTEIELYTRLASIYTDESENIAPRTSVNRELGKDFEGNFRNGSDDSATLVEFSTKGHLSFIWYDISTIPARLKPDHVFCKSLEECIQNSATGSGFNTPVQVTPLSNTNGNSCRELTCLAEGCEDSYQFPQDDSKTHACPFGTDFIVTFCPSGDATQQQAQTELDSASPYGDTKAPETTAPVSKDESPDQTTVSGDTQDSGVKNETQNIVPVVTNAEAPISNPATPNSKHCV